MRKTPGRAWICLWLLALGLGFGAAPGRAAAPESAGGRTTGPAAADTDGVIRILLYYDMEGTSGQNSTRSVNFGTVEYGSAREDLTADVNAVVAGLAAGGADSIVVVDAHGSFNPEPDILVSRLAPPARMIAWPKRFDVYTDLLQEGVYDGIVAVAMHSRTGGGGFAAHTVNIGTEWILNDMPLCEAELFAYSWGRIGVPLLLVTGDDRLAEQLAWMDWLQYVTVKRAKGTHDAELRPGAEVRAEMRAKAERAVRQIAHARAARLAEPIQAQMRTEWPASLDVLDGVPGVDYRDGTVTFTAPDFTTAYRGERALLGAAQTGYMEVLFQLAMEESGGVMFERFKEKILSAWDPKGPPQETAPAPKPAARPSFGAK